MSSLNDDLSFPNTLSSASTSQQVLDPVNAEAALILAKCHQFLEDYRHRRRSKLATAIELARVIPDSHLEASDGRRALDTYLATLDEELVEFKPRGRARPADAPRPTVIADPGDAPALPELHRAPIIVDLEPPRVDPTDDAGPRAFAQEPVPDFERAQIDPADDVRPDVFGRERVPDIIARPLSRGSSVQPDEPAKRRRLDESALPWATAQTLDLPLQLVDLADKTRASLAFFAKDIKVALASVLNSTSLVSFPESEWLALLKGQAVNLDKVAATFHNVAVESHASHKLGDGLELRLGLAEPARRIQSVEEWKTPGQKQRRLSSGSSHTEGLKRRRTSNISSATSSPPLVVSTPGSSSSTRESACLSRAAGISPSPASTPSPKQKGASCLLSAPTTLPTRLPPQELPSLAATTNLAVVSTTDPAHLQPVSAGTLTSASPAKGLATPRQLARLNVVDRPLPRYLRGFLWDASSYSASPTALSTLLDDPLPRPPLSEFHSSAVSTLSSHSHLFKIVTPVNVPAFQMLLRGHPNPDFVQSVSTALPMAFGPGRRPTLFPHHPR